ncbi:diheme cytochrome c [Roseateles oligotrophus]|uniref:Diheme cytochrome c n=1 Tax=Roseateles oligotrophus TaxID=1769250 RepID=A0ABT2YCX6_9BURK|nr:diheme cytochrome c [Roseateles oligotrophus]MCV2367870.1 diheme cytochrome c [Roseateles oligotrophus]
MKTLLLFGLGLSLFAAQADDGHALRGVPLLPKYQQECAACHLAYPPGMLPVASWQRLMANLPKHFASDASLDSASVAELNRWLVANAGTYKRVGNEPPPADRISRSTWFIRKHDEVAAATWQRAGIKSAANCAACHPQAEQGDFNEHRVRIPK